MLALSLNFKLRRYRRAALLAFIFLAGAGGGFQADEMNGGNAARKGRRYKFQPSTLKYGLA
jgi:hypothetical protein